MARAQSRPDPRKTQAADEATLAQTLAPEEIRPGDFVAILHEVCELPSYMWCGDAALLPRDELVRIRLMPSAEAVPLKVRAVCLPFVLAKEPAGRRRTLDVRRCRLARLDWTYAKEAWSAYRRPRRGKKKDSAATS